ncbi:GNAT family N-acetyltransferase [Dyadobacter fanqingshengii]|uniref:GNAT family N-acetyltransferase n=1 Tax=Dyadobacter fanqingshengii TaxID=2906443 RepID=A0A9X1P8E1_9BACT|nr:GNAT family N-acetyltransferase [Dyadobacter fanqingshengii]MCF0040651.1 GNAT family N-acetyltransferase [Dyadobacter fanqingshengii]USJ37611.1 GNAT family N-acetyltransferase [Dyadobacter fanqingshengii]
MKSSKFLTADLPQLPAMQPADWGDLTPRFAYFIPSPHCHPIKISENGELIAIGTAITHADTVWLACIVVHAAHRKKGLGNAITQDLIANIDRTKYKTIYLDATEYGYPVYAKLGFEVETTYTHMRKTGGAPVTSFSNHIVQFEENYLDQIFDVDQQVSGEDRSGVISDFAKSSLLYVVDSQVQGFYIPEWGDGPIIAISEAAGAALIKRRAMDEAAAVLPTDNDFAISCLEEHHFQFYRTSRRMFLGETRIWQPTGIYNRISGQLG